jgi:steroid delta-isomerase-like uncharacterized protein
MATETAEQFMRALKDAERSGDAEPLVAMFADDAEVSNLVKTEPLRGLDGTRQFWQDYLKAFERIESEFTHTTASDEGAALEWVSEGTLPTGKPIRYRGVSILDIADGKVRRFMTYYDSAAFLPEGAKGAEG